MPCCFFQAQAALDKRRASSVSTTIFDDPTSQVVEHTAAVPPLSRAEQFALPLPAPQPAMPPPAAEWRPARDPPSHAEVEATLADFNLPFVRHQDVFWGDRKAP